ncbi:MMPL family transporter [Metabacillus fastidiosus]|uniref:MMPL family transporter n=1 Tax=Metabacillus fastidiosus TaxID=1458 RepID=UPI003D278674
MYTIVKGKWLVLIAWILVVVGLIFAAPNIAELVREKGQNEVPAGYSSTIAEKILDDVRKDEGKGEDSQVALVFHNEKKLTSEQIKEAEQAINVLEKKKDKLGITDILTHFKDKELKDQLVSKDGKTILTSLTVEFKGREASEVSSSLYEAIKDTKLDYYYTSGWMIDEDITKNSEEGLKKTEGITLVFILAVLFLVFRSAVAPVIPLVTVGITYITSQSIVSILVDKLDFPLSNFTQIFLVAILFGIGTDYCILLLSRFKEEIGQKESITEAIVETYRTAGRTVFFSGLAVMIGFAAIGFSTFKLYKSASAVAVGVAILLIALFTIVPFFMSILGPKIFWPSKGTLEHKDSKFWGVLGQFSLKRPFIAILVVAAVSIPFLINYDGKLSFNALEEVSGDVASIKAFNIISDSFGAGDSMPTQIVIKNDDAMNNAEYVALAEKISQELIAINHVDTVRSVTRPTGEKIEDLFVAKQAETLGEGLGEGKDGIKQISEGLQEAGTELKKSEPQLKEATKGINDLITGTNEIKSGMSAVQTNLSKIEDGIRQGSAGSAEIKKHLGEVDKGIKELSTGSKQLLAGYKDVSKNLSALQKGYSDVGTGLNKLSEAAASITEEDYTAIESHEGVSQEPSYVKVKTIVEQLKAGLPEASKGLAQLNGGMTALNAGMNSANQGLEKSIAGQEQLVKGLPELIKGLEEQKKGLEQLASGQGQIVDNLPKLTGGLTELGNGQKQLLDGFSNLDGQMGELTDGLTQSADGLNEVSEGLTSAQDYLSGLASTSELSGFYIPDEVLESEEFGEALNAYMSKDGKIMTMDVIFEQNPYSNEAMANIPEIKEAVKRATKDTKLENATVAIGGVTSTYADLDSISQADYTRTVVLMLVGISIILVFLFRSLIMPIYLIGSLILTYYTAMAISEVIFVNILGYSGISWAVPFFSFVILVALGIDYSIFLMDRFSEYKDLSVNEAMLLSMKKMGTVIISAAIILGGTFAAMMPSGVLSLLQIATIILTGLFLYALVILPLFVPVMVRTFGVANWWPFKR